ncbi:MAG: hypothetical protein O3B04_08505 [Chloroflexi bacterium]|nr:hypothetical protein [Chloroflexota bacterium]MDA1298021.1 hypothetical protein [Chloroflexota bacterium]
MRPERWNRTALISAIALSLFVLAGACRSGGPDTPSTSTPSGTTVQPVSFPFIFSGKFTVAGEPGPQGVPIFARLGDGRGPFNNAIRPGEYTNVSISANSASDAGKEITFYLGHPDGPTVRAEETYVFNVSAQPQFFELDLSFPRLP